MKETKIVELVIADDSQELAIDAISLVNSPAIEQDFVFFGKEKNNLTFAKVDEEKRMLVSPALIPNKQIFRYDPNTDSEYYVFFSKATVAKAAYLYLKHNNHHKATYEHKIKDGTLKGLSIEGYFANKFEQMNKKEFTTEEIRTALKELLSVQKVELGLMQDVLSLHNKIEGFKDDMDGQLSKAKMSAIKVDTEIKNFEKLAGDVEKTAKELGIPVKDMNLQKLYTNIKDWAKDATAVIKA
jgi:hypothetical protein